MCLERDSLIGVIIHDVNPTSNNLGLFLLCSEIVICNTVGAVPEIKAN